MRALTLFGIFMCGFQLCFAQPDKERYEAWLDSMQNQKYIGFTMQLDDVIILDSTQQMRMHDPKMQMNMRCTDQLMHGLPGVNMIRRGNFANEPMLRGLTSERYVLSIDGMRIYGACTDKMDPASSYIEPINLERLDVSFGCQSNMVGCGTGGGVDFGLKKPIFAMNDPLRISAQSSFSSVSTGFDQALDLNYTTGKWAMRFSGVHRNAENYWDGNGNRVNYSQFEKFNYATSINYRVNDQSLLAFDFVGDDANNVGYPALPMDVSFARAKLFGLSYLTNQLWVLTEPEIKLYHNFINHEMDDTKRDSVALHMDMPGETQTTGGFIRGFLQQTGQSTMEVKADYHQTFWHAEMTMYPNELDQLPMFMLTWPDAHRSILGFELNHTLKLAPTQQLRYSGRMEKTNSFIDSDFGERQLSIFNKSGLPRRGELLTNASVRYHWDFTQVSQLNFSLAYGERVPTISEQYGFYLFNQQDGYDYLGDPDLKKERNVHLEINQQTQQTGLTLETSVFAYFFGNYIMGIYDPSLSAMTIGALGVKWYENTGTAQMYGGELTLSNQFFDGWTSKLDMKYVYGRDFEGEPLPQMPPAKLSYSLNRRVSGWNIQPEIVWSWRQNRSSNKFNERTTPSFTLLNLRVSKFFEGDHMNWSLGTGIENITNTAYREHFDVGQILRPGRNLYLNLKVSF